MRSGSTTSFSPQWGLVALALVLASPAVRADSVADEADFRFRHGAALYRQGKLEDALGEFLASNRLVHNRNVLINIARCYEQLKMANEAWRAYADLQGETLKEADKKDLEAALARLRPLLALLEVKSEPPGATVYVDRKDLGARGQTPLVIALPPGKANVMVEEGYKPGHTEVQLAIGKSVLAEHTLERIYGTLVAEGEPSTYELRVDTDSGEPVLTQNGSARVLPGKRSIHVSGPGLVSQQLLVDVPPEGSVTTTFKLVPIPPPSGTLVVKANIDGALIRIDGKESGFTPGVIDSVLSGKRKVEITSEGREPVVREVVVKTNERSFLEVRLRYAQPKVVAAERKLTRAEDAPASITVISGDEIRGFGYATLSEALRSVRGLYVTDDRTYNATGVRGFSTPGTNNNRVLVLNDGHNTNELTYGQGYVGRDFDVDLSDVERIEVIRGPGSVLYGSAAFFAVVNLVHRPPPPGVHGRVAADIESNEGTVGHATGSWATEDKYVWARVAGSDITGDRYFKSPDATGDASGIAENQDRETAQHADVRSHVGDFTISGSINSRQKQIPTGPFDTYYGQPGTNVWDMRAFAELLYSHSFDSGWGVDARVSYDRARYKGNWQYKVGPGYDLNSEDWVSGEARVRLPEFFKNHVFIGGEAQDRYSIKLESFVPGNPFFNNAPGNPLGIPDHEKVVSAYLGDEVVFTQRFRINAAVRADDYPDSFGLAVNPRVAALFSPYDGGSTKLLFGTAFRAPGFAERYFTDGVQQAQAVNLQPETIMTGELEHVHQLTDETTVTVSGYWSRIANLIGLADVGDGSGQIRFSNLPGLTHSAGVEAEIRWQPAPGAFFTVWYAYAHARGPNGEQLPNSVDQSGAVRMLYPVLPSVLSFATELIYGAPRLTVVDADNPVQSIGGSLRWNAGIAGAYNRWNVRYGVFVQNLLDEKINLPAGPEIPFAGHQVPQVARIIRVQLAGTF